MGIVMAKLDDYALGRHKVAQAVSDNNQQRVRDLLAKGHSPSRPNAEGFTPLHIASREGYAGIARMLLEAGADPNCQDPAHRGGGSRTPLHWAACYGFTELASVLIRAGAGLEALDEVQQTPLHFAAFTGRYEIAKLLVDGGADLNAKNANGMTSLNFAVCNGHEEVARLLVERGADLEQSQTIEGETPIHWASYGGRVALVRFLLNRGAKVNQKTSPRGQAWTPLHYSVRSSQLAVCKLLIEENADTQEVDSSGQTPLQLASADPVRNLFRDVRTLTSIATSAVRRMRRENDPMLPTEEVLRERLPDGLFVLVT